MQPGAKLDPDTLTKLPLAKLIAVGLTEVTAGALIVRVTVAAVLGTLVHVTTTFCAVALAVNETSGAKVRVVLETYVVGIAVHVVPTDTTHPSPKLVPVTVTRLVPVPASVAVTVVGLIDESVGAATV